MILSTVTVILGEVLTHYTNKSYITMILSTVTAILGEVLTPYTNKS